MGGFNVCEWAIGLRPQHFRDWSLAPQCPRFEVLADNYIDQKGGPALAYLEQLTADIPPLLHSVGLNIGGLDPLEKDYLQSLSRLQQKTRASLLSDHACFCRDSGRESYDLLPLPYTRNELQRIAKRIDFAQDKLGMPLALENISAYVAFSDSAMTEMDFLLELTHLTSCRLLLDLNNLFVSCKNLGWDAEQELKKIDPHLVSYMHISGFSYRGPCLYDSHDTAVSDPVLGLLQKAIDLGMRGPIVLERDDAELPYSTLIDEWERIQSAVQLPRASESASMIMDHSSGTSSKTRKDTTLARTQAWESDFSLEKSRPQRLFMQKLFAELLIQDNEATLSLTPSTSENWDIYRTGLIGRWTSLIEATFRRATRIWGKDALSSLLWDFAQNFPPQHRDIGRAFRAMPEFVLSQPDYAEVSGLADFLEISFLYWEILEDEDPLPCSPSNSAGDQLNSRLKHPAGFHQPWQTGFDLFALWTESALRDEDYSESDWQRFHRQERSLLWVKESPFALITLPIDPELYPLAIGLCEGKSLEEAIDRLLESSLPNDHGRLERLLPELLKQLAVHQLLT